MFINFVEFADFNFSDRILMPYFNTITFEAILAQSGLKKVFVLAGHQKWTFVKICKINAPEIFLIFVKIIKIYQ